MLSVIHLSSYSVVLQSKTRDNAKDMDPKGKHLPQTILQTKTENGFAWGCSDGCYFFYISNILHKPTTVVITAAAAL